MPVPDLIALLEQHPPFRALGAAVYLSTNRKGIPIALLDNLKHNKVMHENVILMSVITEHVPRVMPEKRREVIKLSEGLFRVNLHYGFTETPNIPKSLQTCSRELNIDPSSTYFFLARETLIAKRR
jgi:KUP system potassium uptake protein